MEVSSSQQSLTKWPIAVIHLVPSQSVIPCKSLPQDDIDATDSIDQTSIQNRSINAGRVFQINEKEDTINRPPTIIRHSQPSAMTLRVLYLHESVHPDYVAPPAPQRFQRPTVTPEGQEIPQVRQPRPKVYDPEPCFSREGGSVGVGGDMGIMCRSVCMIFPFLQLFLM